MEEDHVPVPQPSDAFDQLIRVMRNVASDIWGEYPLTQHVENAINNPVAQGRFTTWLADAWGKWSQWGNDGTAEAYVDHIANPGNMHGDLMELLRDLARSIDPQGEYLDDGQWRYHLAWRTRGR